MNPNLLTIAHGGGGTRTQALIRELFLRYLGNPILDKLDDAACLDMPGNKIVLTTDSYVVRPLFFPGGDIGRLAVCGTINDIVMQGAQPLYMSMGLILEEGLAIDELEKIIVSAGRVCSDTGVCIVTGDTKVVEKGKGNGVFINTTGTGVRLPDVDVHVGNAQPGDVVIVTGTIGDHGIAVMSMREGLKLESELVSDVAPLWAMLKSVFEKVPSVKCMRDPTRGGLAAALCDIAEKSNAGIQLNEKSLPFRKEVHGACSLLGLDPLNAANEGKAVIVCSPRHCDQVLHLVQQHEYGRAACIVGRVVEEHRGMVVLETAIGGQRIIETPSGEDLPRIC